MREHGGTIMAGHTRERGPLYTSVPFVMFDEGGWVVSGGVVVLLFCVLFCVLFVVVCCCVVL